MLTYERAVHLDIAGPLDVFHEASARTGTGGRPYRTRLVSKHGGPVETSGGIVLHSSRFDAVDPETIDTLLVSGGQGAREAAADPETVDWVRRVAPCVRRTGSVCTGAFVLAAAGLLDGRRAVTHWQHCGRLQKQFPGVLVEVDPIYIVQGNIWTSAGVTAGIDMALAMVERDAGRGVATDVAKSLVLYMRRHGGQAQFSTLLRTQELDGRDIFENLNTWIAENLSQDLAVDDLAARAAMSPRNFSRRYTAACGITPARAVERMRVEAACRMLEQAGNGRSLARVAETCGFGNEERMRRAFLRTVSVPPATYRSRFGGTDTRAGHEDRGTAT